MKQVVKTQLNNMKIDIIAVSKQGDSDKENQDRFQIYCSDTEIIIAVADGLGSAPLSGIGAGIACQTAIETISNNMKFPHDFVKNWKTRISGDYHDYDTTIRFLRLINENIKVGCIGDGWTYVLTGLNQCELHSTSAFLNCTESIMSVADDSYYKNDELTTNGTFVAILSTDGFSEDIDKTHKRELIEDFAESIDLSSDDFANEIEEMLDNWPCKSNFDDKTVVIIRGKNNEKF